MQNKIKIGARKLSENEIKLILPTYENILGQINAIRNSKEEKSSNNNEEKEQSGVEEDFLQKTNNIGIMGCRGSGKTSVLKTIKAKLEEEKYNDIILPIIVPENMSENSTLMATILALLKKYIDEFDSNCSRCVLKCGRDNNDNHLIEMYEETVKQYAFILTIVNKVDRKNENSTYWGQASTRLLGFGVSSLKVFI